jgi:hypothetical protein
MRIQHAVALAAYLAALAATNVGNGPDSRVTVHIVDAALKPEPADEPPPHNGRPLRPYPIVAQASSTAPRFNGTPALSFTNDDLAFLRYPIAATSARHERIG